MVADRGVERDAAVQQRPVGDVKLVREVRRRLLSVEVVADHDDEAEGEQPVHGGDLGRELDLTRIAGPVVAEHGELERVRPVRHRQCRRGERSQADGEKNEKGAKDLRHVQPSKAGDRVVAVSTNETTSNRNARHEPLIEAPLGRTPQNWKGISSQAWELLPVARDWAGQPQERSARTIGGWSGRHSLAESMRL